MRIDATTADPGKYRHEKMISGAYLGALCLFAAKRRGTGRLSFRRRGCRAGCRAFPGTRELNDFLLYPDGQDNPLGAGAAACRRG